MHNSSELVLKTGQELREMIDHEYSQKEIMANLTILDQEWNIFKIFPVVSQTFLSILVTYPSHHKLFLNYPASLHDIHKNDCYKSRSNLHTFQGVS